MRSTIVRMVLITARKIVALFTLVLLPVNVVASVQAVWAVNDGEKVERDDLNNTNKSANSAWDGRKIKIFGARNEIIAFQVIVEAGTSPIQKLSVSLNELRQISGDARIKYS